MKRKLVLLIIIILLVAGCNSNEKVVESNKPVIQSNDLELSDMSNGPETPDINNSDESISILDVNYIISDSYYNYDIDSSISWSNYFNDKYDISINLNYINNKTIDYVFNEKIDGVLYLTNGAAYIYNKYIYNMIENNKLLDLKPYYVKYNWDQLIDSKYIKPVSNGAKIFAIPVASNITVLQRYYNSEYLKSLNISIPMTIDEFTEYLAQVKNLYPESYPLFFNQNSAGHCTADLFRSFDVYINAYNESAISFNPKTESFEDAVFSDNFNLAFSYIRMLQENEYMNAFSLQPGDLPDSLILASEFNFTYYRGQTRPNRKPDYEYQVGYFLEGINKEKLVEMKKDISFYVLPEFSGNADSLMERLNIVLRNSDYYFDLKYGIEEVNYEYGSNNGEVMIKNEFRGILQPENTQYSIISDKEVEEFISSYPNELMYETNTYYDLFTFSKMLSGENSLNFKKFGDSYNTKLLMDMFNTEINISNSIETYKTEFKKYGINTLINSFNKKLGFTTKQIY
ncbi:MAG: hypothetical protein JXQ23_09355 [Clostridia bacterium]|nr:hypothetical protein [Clostridia bacterium]